MKTKTCTKCGIEKELSNFYKNCDSKDGFMSQCKDCFKIYVNINKDRIYKKQKDYKKSNEKHVKEYFRNYRLKNKRILALKAKSNYNKNKKAILQSQANYYQLNKERIKQTVKFYSKNNRTKINNRLNKKRKSDINFRLLTNLRSRTSSILKSKFTRKDNTTLFLLGCSLSKLRQHLKSQFTEGMTLDNYGKFGWQIDHIIPCAKFNLSITEEQKKCFNYKNLQPLWALDNQIKGDNYV